MGRGLSDLQKTMIKLSWDIMVENKKRRENREIGDRWVEWRYNTTNYDDYILGKKVIIPIEFIPYIRDNWDGRVFFSDVFKKVYGWKPIKPRNTKDIYLHPEKFSKKKIGLNNYMAAYVAVKKALKRLEERGLVNIGYKVYSLTNEGWDIAKLLV